MRVLNAVDVPPHWMAHWTAVAPFWTQPSMHAHRVLAAQASNGVQHFAFSHDTHALSAASDVQVAPPPLVDDVVAPPPHAAAQGPPAWVHATICCAAGPGAKHFP